MCACVRACMHACVCACMRACKQEDWVCLKNAPSNDISHIKTEYNHLMKLTQVAAGKARNSCGAIAQLKQNAGLLSVSSKAEEAL